MIFEMRTYLMKPGSILVNVARGEIVGRHDRHGRWRKPCSFTRRCHSRAALPSSGKTRRNPHAIDRCSEPIEKY